MLLGAGAGAPSLSHARGLWRALLIMDGAGGHRLVHGDLAALLMERTAMKVAVGARAARSHGVVSMVRAFGRVYVDGAIEGRALFLEPVRRMVGGGRRLWDVIMVDDGDLRTGSVPGRCVHVVDQSLLLASRCNDSSWG